MVEALEVPLESRPILEDHLSLPSRVVVREVSGKLEFIHKIYVYPFPFLLVLSKLPFVLVISRGQIAHPLQFILQKFTNVVLVGVPVVNSVTVLHPVFEIPLVKRYGAVYFSSSALG